jgi:prepilin signal peptidase PulO-like enzyme (type II secretory pathway)
MPVFEIILVGLLGIIAGGVVNALSDDLPMRRPVRLPHYPDDTPRPFIAWLGITTFLFGKRVSPNGVKLRWRYPLTEIATTALFIITLLVAHDDIAMNTAQFIVWLIYMAIFMLITVIDLEHRLILFVVIIPSCVLALLDAAFLNYGANLKDSILGALIGFGIFFLLYVGGFFFTYILGKLRGEEINEVAFGYGDVMLITLSGLILGYQALILAMFITVFLGAFGAIIYLIIRRLAGRHYSLFTPLPYGQYIIIATIIMLLFAPEVISFMRFGLMPVPPVR